MPPATKTQPWKGVWPPTQNVVDQANAIPEGLSSEEVTNQRAYGSHASNTKGRIVHIINKKCENLEPDLKRGTFGIGTRKERDRTDIDDELRKFGFGSQATGIADHGRFEDSKISIDLVVPGEEMQHIGGPDRVKLTLEALTASTWAQTNRGDKDAFDGVLITNPFSFTKTYHTEPYPAIDPSRPELSAKGKVVFITGGSRGIGYAIAEAFAQAGAADVVITGRTQETLDAAQRQIVEKWKETRIHTFVADAVDKDATLEVFSHVGKNIGLVDVLVANAGAFIIAPVKDADPDEYWKVIETNTKGVFLAIHAFLKVAAQKAVVINVTSLLGHIYANFTFGHGSAYCASKAATAKLCEYVQLENPDLSVFNLQPGVIRTDLTAPLPKELFREVELPGAFSVWLASGHADFLKGKYIWANWDVDELKQREKEITADPSMLSLCLGGFETKYAKPN
ncbi:MAG: hypothetical protein M1816_006958 [Peltula sp. TS41687]|nr:MAG: hypothetical protein M1816_006958 [Peltula sp. TS41687]